MVIEKNGIKASIFYHSIGYVDFYNNHQVIKTICAPERLNEEELVEFVKKDKFFN